MSIKAMTWAFSLPLEPRAKLALLAIADNARDDGIAWPSRDTIAEKSSQSRSTVGRRIKSLVGLGIIAIKERFREDGTQTTDEIHLDLSLSPDDVMRKMHDSGEDNEAEDGDERGTRDAGDDAPASDRGGCQPDTLGSQSGHPGVSLVTGGGLQSGHPQDEPSVEPDSRGNARARPVTAFTAGSKALADAFWKALGIKSPLQIPPELAGIDYRAVQWEQAGWTADLIEAEARRFASDRPPKPISYFEKVFATASAKRQAPLPIVEVRKAEQLTVTRHGTSRAQSGGSLIAAIDRRIAALEAEDAADPALPAANLLLLSSGTVRGP